MTPQAFALQMIGIIAFVAFAPRGDMRGCKSDTPTWEAAQGKIICPQPKTTTYGFNRPVREVK
jgi:hypothetical protein